MKLKSGYSFWIHSVFFTLLNRFSLIAFGVIGYIILAKKVFPTTKEMGVWALFLSILALIETIKQGLLRNPTIKFLSEPEYVSDRNKIQSASLIINILFSTMAIGFVVFGGHLITKWLNTPELYPLIQLGILLIILLVPFNHFEVLLQAHFQFRPIFYGYFLRQGVFLISIVLLLIFHKSALTLINLVRLQILALASGTGILLYFARPYFYRKFDVERKTMLRMFHFGKYIFGTNVFSAFGRSADQFITAGLISADVVAYYNVVARINNMMDVPSLAVADVLFPKNVEAMAISGEEKVKYYFERMVGSIISILAPASLLIFCMPHLFIKLLAGSKYLAAVPILQTVILFSFLRPFSYQFGATMDAIGKPRINFWVNLLSMCLNYGCMYIGLRLTGWMGAAYGTVAAAILSFSIMCAVLNKTIGVRLGETFRYVGFAYGEMAGIIKKSIK
ncbi:MAG: oligosaccharide flippase family protein [Bacteroidota bacterium]|nr:oligosaccharide flippase family protein [Bacteroidota bacterium]MDP4249559.1 oligosaccharide flippase family protein [Bacteroidota bacterium]